MDGFWLTKVLMDGGSGLNLIYEDTLNKMQMDIEQSKYNLSRHYTQPGSKMLRENQTRRGIRHAGEL